MLCDDDGKNGDGREQEADDDDKEEQGERAGDFFLDLVLADSHAMIDPCWPLCVFMCALRLLTLSKILNE